MTVRIKPLGQNLETTQQFQDTLFKFSSLLSTFDSTTQGMSIFTPPSTDYYDHYDRSRFKLVWNITLGVMLLLLFLTIININHLNKASIPNGIALVICVIILLLLKFTHKYKFVSILASVSSCILISNTFFFITDVIHYNTPLWMLLNILFTFFTLGKTWGTVISILHFTAFCLYIGLRLNYNLSIVVILTPNATIDLIAEAIIVGTGIIYLIYQFLRTNKYAEKAIKNINESLLAQNKIISIQNEEKNVMLKEIHHRVKNNLQVITSLLRLQSYELEDPKQVSAFDEAINRVKSMSLIHEKMYQTNLLTNFDFENYLHSLATELISAYSFQSSIDLTIESSVNKIDSKNIVPISLLFNELISNSIKHAFKNEKYPAITIRITRTTGMSNCLLNYSDNGTWIEPTQKSFGSELITAMIDQLDGKMELNTSNGTHYSFTITNLSD